MKQLFANQLFSNEWMSALKEAWNTTPQVHMPLQVAKFTARIGYGFKGEPRARGMLYIVNGKVQDARVLDETVVDLDWDLRASRENWTNWIASGFGVTKLGPAIATNSLEFVKGNYRQMITNMSLGQPFLQHFQLMKQIKVNGNTGSDSINKKYW
jgi:hypothetical protein